MSSTKKDLLTVRLDDELAETIEQLARDKHAAKSEVVREALRAYVERERGMTEVRRVVAAKFAEGALGFDDMVRILGYDQAKMVAYYVEVAEESFDEGLGA